ncbi:MAG TPA: hypothetical protein VMC85_02065 [Desulfomonilaceae bacterium]|nr:hypothetical protein [Desulfomonilaceae bacterium]
MHRENPLLCIVFAMGIEAYPFLRRVEVKRRWAHNRAIYRQAFFEGHSLVIVRSGIGPARAADAIRHLEVRPSAILSVGTAGGLAPDSRIRDIVVACETVFGDQPDGILKCSAELVEAISDACGTEGLQFRIARLATVSKAVINSDHRRQLHQLTGGHAVDMESHAVALEASNMGIPFAALRVISDDVNSPPFPEPRALKELWRRPTQLPSTLPAAMKWIKFIKNFRKTVELLHPALVRLIRNSGKSYELSAL